MADPDKMTTGDGRFTYLSAGEIGAPALVFLHGIGGAARAWREQIESFDNRYRTVAWDMPGYGGSKPLETTSIETLAAALKDFLAQLSLKKPVLIGHSIGGMIVQELMKTDPKLPHAIVLAQTSPAFGKPDGDWQKTFIEARLGPLERGETMKELAPTLVKELSGTNPDPRGMELARDCMAKVPEATYQATMRALIGFDLRDILKYIKLPTLLLAGSEDTNAPAPMMKKMASHIPGATYVELEGVGHLANMERPMMFNAALASFLSAHPLPKKE